MEKHKVLWASAAPWYPSGFGVQTGLFAPLIRDWQEVTIAAFAGFEGAVFTWNGINVWPRVGNRFYAAVTRAQYDFLDSDLLVSFLDPGQFNGSEEMMREMNWCAWAPVHQEPDNPLDVKAMRAARWIWVMSQHGIEQLARENLSVPIRYMPAGVDLSVYQPMERAAARQRLSKMAHADIDENTYLLVAVGNNLGKPGRKGWPHLFEMFRAICQDIPNAMLYLHTDLMGMFIGEDLLAMAEQIGVDQSRLCYAQQLAYNSGLLTGADMAAMYNAGDLLIHPSYAEGFGVPLLEAQACGTPVAGTDFSATPEVTFGGYKIPMAAKQWTKFGTWESVPDVRGYVEAVGQHARLNEAERQRMRAEALAGAQMFGHLRVWEHHMKPALEEMLAEIARSRAALNETNWEGHPITVSGGRA